MYVSSDVADLTFAGARPASKEEDLIDFLCLCFLALPTFFSPSFLTLSPACQATDSPTIRPVRLARGQVPQIQPDPRLAFLRCASHTHTHTRNSRAPTPPPTPTHISTYPPTTNQPPDLPSERLSLALSAPRLVPAAAGHCPAPPLPCGSRQRSTQARSKPRLPQSAVGLTPSIQRQSCITEAEAK